jgi:cellulose synthase operon protein C
MRLRLPIHATLLSAMLFLSACDTAQERAERYFQSGMSYLQAGDVDRALVEFRNVFKLDGGHRAARIAYAEAERKRGNVREAYSQYLRLVEQYPNDLDGLRALAEMAVTNGQWNDADHFVTTALAIAPDDLGLQSIRIFKDYGAAIEINDPAAMLVAVKAARDLRVKAPDELLLRKVIIDDRIRAQSLDEALGEIDDAIKIAPNERILYAQRLSVLAALGEDSQVEAGLIDMVAKFPDAPEMKDTLVRWYLARKEYDKAEANLRAQIDPASDNTDPEVELVRFLGQYRGPEAAIAELDRAIASGKSVPIFRSARAGFEFDRGDRDLAIAEMQDILKTAPAGDDARSIKVGLARMQLAVGNSVAARALVEDVLSEDSGQIEAIKLKATWLILGDQVNDAVTLLRDAIDQNPRDASLMTLMAQAYERDGNRDLMREMLSQAVEASGRAPAESLRYAQLLASENKLLPAEGVLIDALRIAPGDRTLLLPLGQIYVEIKDWSRAESVAKELESLGDSSLSNDIAGIRAAILQGQKRTDDAVTYLERLATGEGAQIDAKIAVLRNHLNNGRNADALAYSAQILAEDPSNLDLQYINGAVQGMVGNTAAAEEAYRKILDVDQNRPLVWMALFRSVYSDPNRKAEAEQLLDHALAVAPNSSELRWAKAGILEADGDIDGAIAIYEAMYQENSANPIVANNLASLLSNYRTDPDSLARAEVIARRLRGSDLAPYQDTYGWIAYQNKNYDGAVDELEKAVVGLPKDPTVRYHLAMTYLALQRPEDAAKQFKSVVDELDPSDSRNFAVSARDEYEKLKKAGFANELP